MKRWKIGKAMESLLSSLLRAYRQYRIAKAKSRPYKVFRYALFAGVTIYLLLLSFPQVLFAHESSYKNFSVYSREPLEGDLHAVIDQVEAKLSASGINTDQVKPRVFLTNSHTLYAALSLYIGGNSFGKGYPLLPTENIFINKADLAKDLVYRNSPTNNQRTLSGVIAHETTHLLIRKRFGYWKNLSFPVWKREGFCEYVAGGSTLSYEEGVRMWKQNPQDGTGYQYFKYYMLVKYLLENEKLTVPELFNKDIDVQALEAKVLSTL